MLVDVKKKSEQREQSAVAHVDLEENNQLCAVEVSNDDRKYHGELSEVVAAMLERLGNCENQIQALRQDIQVKGKKIEELEALVATLNGGVSKEPPPPYEVASLGPDITVSASVSTPIVVAPPILAKALSSAAVKKAASVKQQPQMKSGLLRGHTREIICSALSLDGRWLATGSYDNTIKIWNLLTCTCELTLEGHTEVIWSLAWSPDGGFLASSSTDHTIKIWDLQKKVCVRTLKDLDNTRQYLKFFNDMLVSGSLDFSSRFEEIAKIWDLKTGACLFLVKNERAFEKTTLLLDAEAAFVDGAAIRIRNLKTHNMRTLVENTGKVYCLKLLPNGNLVSCTEKGIHIWNTISHECLKTIERINGVERIKVLSEDLLVGGDWHDNSPLTIWDLKTNKTTSLIDYPIYFDSVTLLRNDNDVLILPKIVENANGTIYKTVRVELFSIRKNQWLGTKLRIEDNSYPRRFLTSPANQLVMISKNNSPARNIMQIDVSEPITLALEVEEDVKSINEQVVVAAASTAAKPNTLVPASTNIAAAIAAANPSVIVSSSTNVAPSDEDALSLLSSGEDTKVRLEQYNVSSSKAVQMISGDKIKSRCLTGLSEDAAHLNDILCFALSPDGSRLASGSKDHTIKIWNLESGTFERTLKGHSDYVSSLLWLSNGRLVSGSRDRTSKIWDMQNRGECIQTLTLSSSDDYSKLLYESGADNITKIQNLVKDAFMSDLSRYDDPKIFQTLPDNKAVSISRSRGKCYIEVRVVSPISVLEAEKDVKDKHEQENIVITANALANGTPVASASYLPYKAVSDAKQNTSAAVSRPLPRPSAIIGYYDGPPPSRGGRISSKASAGDSGLQTSFGV